MKLWRMRLGRPSLVGLLVLAAAAAVALTTLVSSLDLRAALNRLRREGGEEATLKASLVSALIGRYAALPTVLSTISDVREPLDRNQDVALKRLNHVLETLAGGPSPSIIYIVRASGITVAASNWSQPGSFVGQDYRFRPYFQQAMRHGAGELFALGTVSGKAGLYLSQRITGAGGRALGAVVVKVDFSPVIQGWRAARNATFVTDARGVVLMSSEPDWQFKTVRPLDAATQSRFLATRQFGRSPLKVLQMQYRLDALSRVRIAQAVIGGHPGSYLEVSAPISGSPAGWTLHLLSPIQPVYGQTLRADTLTVMVLSLLATGVVATVWVRRNYLVSQAASARAASAALEIEVAARTRDLRTANEHLQRESDERAQAEELSRRNHDELVQAGKLASLGQVVAGVAHEINQPLAAIRTYADNATVFLERGSTAAAVGNLEAISGLTERVGAITSELRQFARRGERTLSPVSLSAALDGALTLTQHQVEARGVTIEKALSPSITVLAERSRLEQVLLNLVQNALDATQASPQPLIHLSVREGEDVMTLDVEDNGDGLAEDLVHKLFLPFFTTKANGLGLGLVISRDIAVEMGGSLNYRRSELGGACFSLTLPRML